MAGLTEIDFFESASLLDDEEQATLATAGEGIRDGDAWRTVPTEVRLYSIADCPGYIDRGPSSFCDLAAVPPRFLL